MLLSGSRLRLVLAFGVLAAAGAAGCAATVRQTTHPALAEQKLTLTRVAVAPFGLSPAAAREAQRTGVGGEQAALVSARIAEALAQSGLAVIGPDDLRRALGPSDGGAPVSAATAARVAHERFGADAVVIGTLSRWHERGGRAAGTTEPASVGFEATLVRAPGGEKLWTGVFDETQRALTENVFNIGRYPGGGTRWLSAEEMTRWGAESIARAMPRGD